MGFPLKQPTRARLIKRLEHEPVRILHYDPHHIEISYDGQIIEDRIVVQPFVPMVGSWSRTSDTVYVDRKVPKAERKAIAVHEAVERYAALSYGLDPMFDAHVVASGPEARVVEHMGISLNDYNMTMEGIFRANLRRHKGHLTYVPGINR